jgi:hypothetical protein
MEALDKGHHVKLIYFLATFYSSRGSVLTQNIKQGCANIQEHFIFTFNGGCGQRVSLLLPIPEVPV